jgi:hypothetical protein
MQDITGNWHRLHAKLKDVPCSLNVFTFKETFFESNDWNSHFQIILGQPFLSKYQAEMSWITEGEQTRIDMKLYTNRLKSGPSITV